VLHLDDAVEHIDSERQWLSPFALPRSTHQTYARMQRAGGRLLLTGIGGDGVMGNFLEYHQDVSAAMRGAHPWRALNTARLRAIPARRTIWDLLWTGSTELRPQRVLVDRMLSNTLAAHGTRRVSEHAIQRCLRITREQARWWRDEWRRQCARALDWRDLSRRTLASQIIMMADRRHAQAPSDEPLSLTSHPYLDRQLVEFMLGLPIDVVTPPGQPRGLMRRAFAPFVPERVINRFAKGYVPPLEVEDARGMIDGWLAAPDQLRLLQLDVLDPDAFVGFLRERQRVGDQPELFVLMVRIERWLRTRESFVRQARRSPSDTGDPLPLSAASAAGMRKGSVA
jgi:hypothetical protein